MAGLITFFQNSGTKVLGFLVGTLGIIANTSDIIPQAQLKYWLLAIAVLTYWRGMANTNAIATVVTQQHNEAMVEAAKTGVPVVTAKAGELSEPMPNMSTTKDPS